MVAVAKFGTTETGATIQKVDIELTDQGFSPAIIVVQTGLVTEWNIINNKETNAEGGKILVSSQSAQLELKKGDTLLYFLPSESFDFSNEDNTFYGYVKVVDSLDNINADAIKAEVAAYKTLIYPPEFFEGASGGSSDGASCH